MKVILLKGHGRGITQILYNREGDLLFSASKGQDVCVWYSENGERLGTYHGHKGAVYAMDVTRDSSVLLTGAADDKVKMWEVETGREIYSISTLRAPVRAVRLSQGEDRFVAVTDAVLGYKAKIHIFPFSKNKDELTDQPIVSVEMTERFKILDALWSPLNKHIIAGTDDGRVLIFDAETLKQVHEIRDNQRDKEIKRLHQSKDRYSFITASTDHTARLYDAETFENIKVYETGRPCNAAAFNEHTNHVFLAGGQSASEVTQTRVDPTQFASRIYHKIFTEELALVQGHFGPVNDLQVNPNGQSFATGGEDGYVRLNFLDDSYTKGLSDEIYLKKLSERVASR